jgi:hypothetical protein
MPTLEEMGLTAPKAKKGESKDADMVEFTGTTIADAMHQTERSSSEYDWRRDSAVVGDDAAQQDAKSGSRIDWGIEMTQTTNVQTRNRNRCPRGGRHVWKEEVDTPALCLCILCFGLCALCCQDQWTGVTCAKCGAKKKDDDMSDVEQKDCCDC